MIHAVRNPISYHKAMNAPSMIMISETKKDDDCTFLFDRSFYFPIYSIQYIYILHRSYMFACCRFDCCCFGSLSLCSFGTTFIHHIKFGSFEYFESSTANIEHHKTYTLSSCVVNIVNTLHHLKSNKKQKGGVHCMPT